MNLEVKVVTDVSAADEPLLQVIAGTTKYVTKYVKYEDTNADETALITKMAIAARVACEKFLNISLAEKTLCVDFSKEYAKRRRLRMELPYGPVGTVNPVLLVAPDGTTTASTLNTGHYLLGNQFKEIQFFTITGTFGTVTTDCDFRVTYTAGYGISEETESMPEAILMAMDKLVHDWYHKRENWIPILTSEAEQILFPFRRRAWF
jgi:hypothetical protein